MCIKIKSVGSSLLLRLLLELFKSSARFIQCCGSLFVEEQFKIVNEQPRERRELRGGSIISRARNFLLAENESRGDVR